MKVSRYPCRKLLSPLKPSSSLRPASPFQHLTSAFSYSSELFCTRQKLNSFLFKQFRTLLQKHPGVGYLWFLKTLFPSKRETWGCTVIDRRSANRMRLRALSNKSCVLMNFHQVVLPLGPLLTTHVFGAPE